MARDRAREIQEEGEEEEEDRGWSWMNSRPTVSVFVGQCGTRIGEQLLKQTDDAGERSGNCVEMEYGRNGDRKAWRARCVFVDSEPRAVRRVRDVFASSSSSSSGQRRSDNGRDERRNAGTATTTTSKRHGATPRCGIRDDSIVFPRRGGGGRGNNWAHGYASASEAPSARGYAGERDAELPLVEAALERVRRETERCCTAPDILMCVGAGGGTGAGVGSRLIEGMRDTMGSTSCITAAASFSAGAGDDHFGLFSPLEAYNATLCVQWLQSYADAVLVFDNGALSRELNLASGIAKTSSTVGEDDAVICALNSHVASTLARLLMPLGSASGACGIAAASPLADFATTVCPIPALRFAEARSASIGGAGSTNDVKTATLQLLRGCRYDPYRQPRINAGGVAESIRASTATTLARVLGSDASGMSTEADIESLVTRCIRENSGQVRWVGSGNDVDALAGTRVRISARCPTGLSFYSRPRLVRRRSTVSMGGDASIKGIASDIGASITLASCRSSTRSMLDRLSDRCSRLLDHRAYCHYYESHGCPVEAILDALDVSRAIADSYASFGLR